MAKVIGQIKDHPLMPLLNKYIDSQTDIAGATARGKPYKPRGEPKTILSKLGTAIFKHCVEKWYALPEEGKEWYNENAPPQFCTGFLWFTWSCLIKNYGAGPWTVATSAVGGHAYIRPLDAPEGIWATGYVDATEIGTLAHIGWEEGCPDKILPLILVHGWYPGAFDPADTWRTMALALTGKDPTKGGNYTLLYDPERPGDPQYALRRVEGNGRLIYISNYTHLLGNGTPGDIRAYAKFLAREIALVRDHERVDDVDILAHSMGALVARAYIENRDLSNNPWAVPYRKDVRALIMLAPPNRGAYFHVTYPTHWFWTSVEQMKHGSAFLTQLNSGTTGRALGVKYRIIAGNPYKCPKYPLTPTSITMTFLVEWGGILEMWSYATIPHHAALLCTHTEGQSNDGEIVLQDTVLWAQDGQTEVTPDTYHMQPWDHWDMRGLPAAPCETATLVQIILAEYTIEKWKAKGKAIEPPQMNFVQHALYVIKKSKTAFPIHNHIVEHNVGIEVEELPPGILAKFDDLGNAIIIDPAAKAEPAKVVAQYLVHEGEHARWYPVDSIYQEYHAFKAEADFWNEVRKGTAHETCDWVAGFVGQGKRAAMDYIRTIPGNQHLPTYALLHDDLEQAADILDDTKHGQPAFLATQRKGVEFTFATNARGAFAWYWIHENKGAIDPDFQDEHPKVLAACLAYLTMRAAWDCGDSIDQELSSFKAMARIWGDIRRDLTHSFLDLVRSTAKLGDDPLRTWIRRQPEYSDLPESYP